MKNLINQMIRFGFVGVFCFLVQYGVMVALKELAGFPPVFASACGFIISTVVNYILSILFVFKVGENHSKSKDFVTFCVLSCVGLGVNSLIMYIGVNIMDIHYMITQIGATAIVMVYNFITRKIFLEH